MTSTITAPSEVSTTGTTRSNSARRTVRSFAITLTAAVAATAATAGLGLGPSTAQADPGDTFLAIGSSQLVQSEDLAAIQLKLDSETVRVKQDLDFSACLGERNPWSSVLEGAQFPITAAWTSSDHKDDKALYESIAQAKTAAQAKRFTHTLLDVEVHGCQGKPKFFDFHYGKTTSSGVGSGHATWAVSYQGAGNRHPDGGVAIIRKGTNFGIVHVSGKFGHPEQVMESVSKQAVSRLA